jgi:hypothetical protein
MPHFADLVGLAGAAVVIVAVTVAAGRKLGLRRSWLGLLAGLGAIAALVPAGSLPLCALLRGVTGDWSLTTLVLLLIGLRRARRGGSEPVDGRSARALQWLVAAGGLVLYPLTLGLGAWDPYRLGYGDPRFLAALLVVAFLSLLLDLGLVTFAVALAVLAWAGGTGESRNLWDYLLDPLVFLWALSSLLGSGGRALARALRRAGEEPLRIRTESSR